MAIKIPSNNIYDIENPIIRDNVIDNVSVEQTIIVPDNQYETPIYNENIFATNDKKEEESTTKITSAPMYLNAYGILGVGAKTNYEIKYIEKIKIPKVDKNKFISKIFDKTNNNDQANIKISMRVTRKITVAEVSSSLKLDSFTSGNFYFSNFDDLNNLNIISQSSSEGNIGLSGVTVSFTATSQYPKPSSWIEEIEFNDNKFSGSVDAQYFYIKDLTSSSLTKDVNITLNDLETNLKELVIDSESDKDNYLLNNLTVVTKSTGYFVASAITFIGTSEDLPNHTFPCRLIKVEQIASSFEITIYGNTIGIDLTDGSLSYIKDTSGNIIQGKGNKPHSLSRNELLQDSGKVGDTAMTEYLAKNILVEYANGKETATLLCDINEYYDESGNLVISTKDNNLPMTFKIGDEVIPYVYGADGKDYPMSKYKDGTSKVFRVVGIEPFYDGAVWQRISLQEILKNT